MVFLSLSWDLVEAICTDGVPTTLGKILDFMAVIKKMIQM
jgi:hypothetical protein